MKTIFKKFILLSLLVLVIISCEKDNDTIPDGQGEVKTSITDGPFPFSFVTSANIGVTKVEVKTATGEYVTLFEGSASYNMVDLTNGATAEVETSNIEAGTYTQARVTVASASIMFESGEGFDSSELGGGASGTYTIEIEPALIVEEGESSEILFDLDLGESFTFFGIGGISLPEWVLSSGMIWRCDFNPHFRVCDRDRTGSISGIVTDEGVSVENANVHIIVDGEIVSTHTESNGTYTFIGVEEGTYIVYVSTADGASVSVEGISVSGTGNASCNITL